LRAAAGRNRADLFVLRTRYAEFAGWLHQDSGHWSAAVWWTERALSSAQETGDQLMTSYVLVKKSQQAEADGDARLSIAYARAAQTAASLTATVRAVALQQEAHGLALLGQADDCQRKLDQALELAARPSDEDQEGPARYCIPEFVEIARANCLMKLGRPRQAVDIFERGLATLPSHHYRDRGVYLGQLAVAHALEGEADPAVARGRQAHEIARATRSHRIVRELRTLRGKLNRWNDRPEVADFRRSLVETTSAR
jgi:tetratricopeptide (TPR) repeat protein